MTVQVSVSDLLGTAMTAASVGASHLRDSRSENLSPELRDVSIRCAIEQLTQALAEATVARFVESRPGFASFTERCYSFDATCEDLIFAISAQLEDYL